MKYIFFLPILFLVVACGNDNVYFQYHAVDPDAWNKDSLLRFDVDIENAELNYNLYINVRNTPSYPKQNLWFFISELTPDGILTKDTIEFYLADHRGKWLGAGAGAIKEMPVLYKQNFKFPEAGIYSFEIGHGMRTDDLEGITEVGLRVEISDY